MKYRLFHGTEPLTEWTTKAAKDVKAWVEKVAKENALTPKVITIGVEDKAAAKPAKKATAKK